MQVQGAQAWECMRSPEISIRPDDITLLHPAPEAPAPPAPPQLWPWCSGIPGIQCAHAYDAAVTQSNARNIKNMHIFLRLIAYSLQVSIAL